MGVVASLAAVGVYGLALELSGRVAPAVLAAALYALIPANYRTVGFVFMREDLSLPLFALHLWLLARAVRLATPAAIALAALALLGAAATWHAMGFVLTLEALSITAWALRSGRNPLAAPGSWLFPAIVAAGAMLVPVLRAKLFVLSPPLMLLAALLALAAIERRVALSAASRMALGLALAAACVAAGMWGVGVLSSGESDYGHVLALVLAKLRFGGELPADPDALPFGARLLWQGPFSTGSSLGFVWRLGLPGLLLPLAVLRWLPGWWRGRGDDRTLVLSAFAVAAVASALLIQRTDVLCGLAAPVAVVLLFDGELRRDALAATLAVLAFQGVAFGYRMSSYNTDLWYTPGHMGELANHVEWIRENVPGEDAIAAEFQLSTAILAHTNHAVVQQPKYETRRSRERIQAFFDAFYRGTPEDFHRLLASNLQARYFALDLPLIWESRQLGGVRRDARAPTEGTAAWSFLHPDPRLHAHVPGFRMLREAGSGARNPARGQRPMWQFYEVLRPATP